MPRSNLDTEETARLRAFCVVVTRHVVAKLPASVSSALQQTLDSIEASPKRNLPISDLLNWTADLGLAEMNSLNAQLRIANAPTLGEMRMEYWGKRIPAILRRGRIRSDEEFYLLKEAADGSGCGLSEADVSLASLLVDTYEAGASSGNA